jgi:ATP-dependent RNA helicase SUPV3L1/SUV3
VLWRAEEIAQLEAGDDPLKPTVVLLADDHLTGPDKEKVQERLHLWISQVIAERLKPLVEIARADDISGLARGIAFRLTESFGVLRRDSVAEEIRALDQAARSQLRKYGVRFGAFNIYIPILLKPAAVELALVLWGLKAAGKYGLNIATLPEPPRAGLTSLMADATVPEAFYRTVGYHVCGARAVRIDMLERLADLIRPLLAFKVNRASPSPPPHGATGDGGFVATAEMMSLLGCSMEELAQVLKALGFTSERRKTKANVDSASVAPEVVAVQAAAAGAEEPHEELFTAAAAADGETTEQNQPPTAGASTATEVSQASPEVTKAIPAMEYLEIWRPRRRGRHERARQHTGALPQHRLAKAEARGGEGTTAATGRREANRRKEAKYRRERERGANRQERARVPMQSAAPSKKATIDPDSPFAALSSLKAQLEKRTQE